MPPTEAQIARIRSAARAGRAVVVLAVDAAAWGPVVADLGPGVALFVGASADRRLAAEMGAEQFPGREVDILVDDEASSGVDSTAN